MPEAVLVLLGIFALLFHLIAEKLNSAYNHTIELMGFSDTFTRLSRQLSE
jgi:hypothetical protein